MGLLKKIVVTTITEGVQLGGKLAVNYTATRTDSALTTRGVNPASSKIIVDTINRLGNQVVTYTAAEIDRFLTTRGLDPASSRTIVDTINRVDAKIKPEDRQRAITVLNR